MITAPYDKIIVRLEYEGISQGGIVIPDNAKQYSGNFWGVVEAVGPDYPYNLKKGAKIHFPRHEGWRFEHKKKAYMCLRAKWINAEESR